MMIRDPYADLILAKAVHSVMQEEAHRARLIRQGRANEGRGFRYQMRVAVGTVLVSIGWWLQGPVLVRLPRKALLKDTLL